MEIVWLSFSVDDVFQVFSFFQSVDPWSPSERHELLQTCGQLERRPDETPHHLHPRPRHELRQRSLRLHLLSEPRTPAALQVTRRGRWGSVAGSSTGRGWWGQSGSPPSPLPLQQVCAVRPPGDQRHDHTDVCCGAADHDLHHYPGLHLLLHPTDHLNHHQQVGVCVCVALVREGKKRLNDEQSWYLMTLLCLTEKSISCSCCILRRNSRKRTGGWRQMRQSAEQSGPRWSLNPEVTTLFLHHKSACSEISHGKGLAKQKK